MKFEQSHRKLIEAFVGQGVDFLLIGGHAAIFYGSERTTSDIDLLVRPGTENGAKILNALHALKLDTGNISPEDFQDQLVLTFGHRPEEVDIMNYIVGLDIGSVFENGTMVEIDGLAIPLIEIRDLLQNKMALNRPDLKGLTDQQDIFVLRKKIESGGS